MAAVQISVLYVELMDVPKNTEFSTRSTTISDVDMLYILKMEAAFWVDDNCSPI